MRNEIHVTRQKATGLGDAVVAVAQPIARALDAVLGTKIQGCGGCKQRQVILNRIMPDVRNPLNR